MTKIVYTSEPEGLNARLLIPWFILQDLLKYRGLIKAMTVQNFRAAHQASYLGTAWQILLPLIMFSIFYLVFGRIFGGRFLNNGTETAVDYALALFIGLGFFNFVAQNINTSTTLMVANASYVKTLSFPLQTLPLISVLNALITFLIGLVLAIVVLFFAKGGMHMSAICTPLYIFYAFLLSLGFSWGLSALAVFVNDVAAVTSPLTLILMFMCPIFYPASMVPERIKWIININPLSVIIEDVRACLLYGIWPSLTSLVALFIASSLFAILGYAFFMKSKRDFADVL